MDLLALSALVIAIILIIPLSWIWPPNSPWAPWWRTKEDIARKAFKMAELKKGQTVYELGSGEATALIVAVRDFKSKGVGIEIDPIRFYLSKISIIRKGFREDIALIRGDLFKQSLKEADVIYVYLIPKTLNRLIPKFKKELRKGTPIVSYKYEMNLPLEKFDSKNKLRLYRI